MTTCDLIRDMLRMSGKSAASVAREMERSDSYIRTLLAKNQDVNASTLVRIAAACGYRIEAVRDVDGERIELG